MGGVNDSRFLSCLIHNSKPGTSGFVLPEAPVLRTLSPMSLLRHGAPWNACQVPPALPRPSSSSAAVTSEHQPINHSREASHTGKRTGHHRAAQRLSTEPASVGPPPRLEMAPLSGTPHRGRGVEPTHLPSEPLPVAQLGWSACPLLCLNCIYTRSKSAFLYLFSFVRHYICEAPCGVGVYVTAL